MGKLHLLEKSTIPDMVYAKNHCAHLYQYSRASHRDVIILLVTFLKAVRTKGITLDLEGNKNFEVYSDAEFCGKWHLPTADNNLSTTKSQTGYTILYSGYPIIWCSKLQTQITLSTMETEYIALSQSLCDAIPKMKIIIKIKGNEFLTLSITPEVYCKAFNNNSGALELARTPKMRPCTKHINQVYHHFWDFVQNGTIQILAIEIQNQISDIFTKPLPQNDFKLHGKKPLQL